MMTNRIRIKVEAGDVKVQQQNRQAKSYVALRSATGCNPQYSRLIYPRVCPYQCGTIQ